MAEDIVIINVRTNQSTIDLVDAAAMYLGLNRSSFMRMAALTRAREVLTLKQGEIDEQI